MSWLYLAVAVVFEVAVLVVLSRRLEHEVVELARTHAQAFRTATLSLDDDARTCLQHTFRAAIGAPAAPASVW